MISLLAPKANGDSAKNTTATREKLISHSCVSRDALRHAPRDLLQLTALTAAILPAGCWLLRGPQMRTTVLLPAIFARFGALRTLLTVADGLQTIRRDAQLHQEVLGRGCAAVAQRQVIFGRSAFVAVPFHHHREIRILLEDLFQQRCVLGEGVTSIG